MAYSTHRCELDSEMLSSCPMADVQDVVKVRETKEKSHDRLGLWCRTKTVLLRFHFSLLYLCQSICGAIPWCWTNNNSPGIHEGSCFKSVVRVVVKSNSSSIIVIVVAMALPHVIPLSVFCCHGNHKRYLRTIAQNLLHGHMQDRL